MSETTTDSHGAGRESSAMLEKPMGGLRRSAKSLDPAEEYKMNYKQRGLALIFNQEEFHWTVPLGRRRGSTADRVSLVSSLKALNFEPQFFDNLGQEGALAVINKAAQEDHSDRDCFLLAFLSHGEGDQVYTNDGKMISIKEMTALFKGDKCPSLVGKPKIFIFQACRGNDYDNAVAPASITDDDLEQEVEEDFGVQTLPAGADFIMCYSVAEGYYSFRDLIKGSWYIQDLCQLLQEYGNSLEFSELLMLVNRKVSMRFVDKARDKKEIGKKQVPCFASMLRKKLYFRPKESQSQT